MPPPIKINKLGYAGVNVDKNPLELDDQELRQSQNTIAPLKTGAGIRKRPGYTPFLDFIITDSLDILGGAPLPFGDTWTLNTRIYLGRGGPAS
jgi:hypothetical protein